MYRKTGAPEGRARVYYFVIRYYFFPDFVRTQEYQIYVDYEICALHVKIGVGGGKTFDMGNVLFKEKNNKLKKI